MNPFKPPHDPKEPTGHIDPDHDRQQVGPASAGYQPHFVFTLSVRGKEPNLPVMAFLRACYPNMPLTQIDSLFGFVERCTLYGGRVFHEPQLSDADIQTMYEHGIGLRIPFTNHTVDEREYASYGWMFDKYHVPGNAVIVTNDKLARWIRRDFPHYRIEASVIKDIRSHAVIAKALDVYDTIVLPMRTNLDDAFLAAIKDKTQITLFANAGCALTCPSKICYPSVSKANKFTGKRAMCSRRLKARDLMGMVDFDLDRLGALGFSRFKMLRERPGMGSGF